MASNPSELMGALRKQSHSKQKHNVAFNLQNGSKRGEVAQRDGGLPKRPVIPRLKQSRRSSTPPKVDQPSLTATSKSGYTSLNGGAFAEHRRVKSSGSDVAPTKPPPPPSIGIPPKKTDSITVQQQEDPPDSSSVDPPPPPPPVSNVPPPPPTDFVIPKDLLPPLPRANKHTPIITTNEETGSELLDIINRYERLEVLRDKVDDNRNNVFERRSAAREQTRRAKLADAQVQDAQAEAAGADTSLFHAMGGWSVRASIQGRLRDLEHRAQAAWKAAKVFDKDLDHAELRLIKLEGKMHAEEIKLFKALKINIASKARSDEHIHGSEIMDEDASGSEATESESDDLSPELIEYFDAVAEINILRERLVELETNYRDQLKIGLETATAKSALPMEKELIETYHMSRAKTVNRLLFFRRKAEDLWREWESELVERIEDADCAPHEEALKYNVGGELGGMYSFHYEESHWGVRPIELRLVPSMHIEDYVVRWLADTELNGWEDILEAASSPVKETQDFTADQIFDDDGLPVMHPNQYSYPRGPEARFIGGRDPVQRSDPGCECCGVGQNHNPVVYGASKVRKRTNSWDGGSNNLSGGFDPPRRFLTQALVLLGKLPELQ